MEGNTNKIICKVDTCEYHTSGDVCTASCIEVGGTKCCSSCDTECVTFKPAKQLETFEISGCLIIECINRRQPLSFLILFRHKY